MSVWKFVLNQRDVEEKLEVVPIEYVNYTT
jgi:hypothetical protein